MPKAILVVDDPSETLTELALALGEAGYAPAQLAAGAAVVEQLTALGPELVFVSLGLADPVAACEAIRADPDGAIVPIILVGNHPEVRSPADALNKGADFFFELPLDRPKLLAKVRTYIGRGDKSPQPVSRVGAAPAPEAAPARGASAPVQVAAGAVLTAEEPRPAASGSSDPAPVIEPPAPARSSSATLTTSADALLAVIEAKEAELGAAGIDLSAVPPEPVQGRAGQPSSAPAAPVVDGPPPAARPPAVAQSPALAQAPAVTQAPAVARPPPERRSVPEPARAEDASRRAEQEAWRRTEQELQRHAEDEARRRALDDADRRRIEEEVRQRIEEETRRRLEDELRRRQLEDTRRKIEDETRRRLEEEARLAGQEAELRRQVEEDLRRKMGLPPADPASRDPARVPAGVASGPVVLPRPDLSARQPPPAWTAAAAPSPTVPPAVAPGDGSAAGGAARPEASERDRIADELEQVRNLDYFQILRISRAASAAEVEAAYEHLRDQFLTARFSPPVQVAMRDELIEIEQVLAEARDVLRNDRLRDSYARHLPA